MYICRPSQNGTALKPRDAFLGIRHFYAQQADQALALQEWFLGQMLAYFLPFLTVLVI